MRNGARVATIDIDQLNNIFDRHAASLALYARQWCEAAEDAVQEAFIALVSQSPAPHDPVGWLYATVRFRAMNLARSEQRRTKHHRQATEQRDAWFEAVGMDRLESIELTNLLQELPEEQREIVVAHIWGELTFDQIARVVERPRTSVYRSYKQAIEQLEYGLCRKCDLKG